MFEPILHLSDLQRKIIAHPSDTTIFLEGPAGCGKTTTGVERLLYLMAAGVPGGTILLILPQRTLAEPYYKALNYPGVVAGGMVTVLTLGGLAQRMVDLFWPLVAERSGFSRPDELPTFLTLETAQYYMARLVQPLLDSGYFDSVVIDRNRLYSQILDNINKSAVVDFPYNEIGERLKEAWIGDPSQLRVYEDTQACVSLFRKYCLEHNLLDFSLQVEVFRDHLWPEGPCRDYLVNSYRHLLVDNLEEDTPVAHDLLSEWLPLLESALLIYDQDASYRRFLGADPNSGIAIKQLCHEQFCFEHSFVCPPVIQALGKRLEVILKPAEKNAPQVRYPKSTKLSPQSGNDIRRAIFFEQHRYYPQMLDWVAKMIEGLVFGEGIPPSEIVVLAPYLSDALRFLLYNRLESLNIPVRSHRPSRSLREEPAAQCLLTLSCLAHPEWRRPPTRFDVSYALVQSIAGMDLVRAQILAESIYRIYERRPILSSFDDLPNNVQERITYLLGDRYETLRSWLVNERTPPDEFDHFLSRLFGEILSQPGFGFHGDINAGEISANLIESVQKFRWVAAKTLSERGRDLGEEYVEMVHSGVIAAQYVRGWQTQDEDAVLVSPAYTFLMINRPVKVQFWLDVGSSGWSERLDQPLAHPYVLSRGWTRGRIWSDLDEVSTAQSTLYTLAMGLLRRCSKQIYLGLSELSEQGYEERGSLLQAFQRLLRQLE